MKNEKMTWETPAPSQQSDSLDLAIIAIGYIHGKAWNDGVLLSNEIFTQILNEFYELQALSKRLSPNQRLAVCHHLENKRRGLSLLDILLNVTKTREETE
jgi:hypothetical protein